MRDSSLAYHVRMFVRRLVPVLAPIFIVFVACAERSVPSERPAPRLVLLVSLDTLRADRVLPPERAGDPAGRPRTPHLAALAAEGLRFETVVAQAAQTLVSHKSLFAGRYPTPLLAPMREPSGAWPQGEAAKDALLQGLSAVGSAPLDELGAAGWRRWAFTDGGWMRAAFGFARPFDVFDEQGGGLEAIVPRVLDALAGSQADAAERAFVFVHAYDTHCPYPTREPFDSRYCQTHGEHVSLEGRCPKDDLEDEPLEERDWQAVRDHYDAGVESADAWLGELFRGLRAASLWEDALVVVTSDHGELLGEGGRLGHGGLSPEELLVPLVIKFPRAWDLGARTVATPVELLDVLPTVLEACGVTVPPGLDGRSLLPLVDGMDDVAGDVLRAETVFRDRATGHARLGLRLELVPGVGWGVVEEQGAGG